MNIDLSSEQVEISIRCIKAFFVGLKWADKFGICGGYTGNRNFRRVFQIDDDHILGVFDNRNPAESSCKNPVSLSELMKLYEKRRCNIKTLIVLEKENFRLASSESQGRQSKFLIDSLYPALEGIRARVSESYDSCRWRRILSSAAHQTEDFKLLSGEQSMECLLAGIYHDPQTTNDFLLEKSPLRYFYKPKSPLNL